MKGHRFPRVICADGFNMSVQAHDGAYCSPRENNAEKYKEVEVGFPSAEEPLLMDYCEDRNDPTGTIYAYVPVGVVTNVIAKHTISYNISLFMSGSDTGIIRESQ